MRTKYHCLHALGLAGMLNALLAMGDLAQAQVPDVTGSSPKMTMNQPTYIWILPQFWMAGDKSYGYFRIDNPLDYTVSLYMHCRTSNGAIPEMTGRHTIRAGGVKIVDSRKYRAGEGTGGSVLVNCSIKSKSLVKVRYLTRDARFRTIGKWMKMLQPNTS